MDDTQTNKCISCAYLCRLKTSQFVELLEKQRKLIPKHETPDDLLYQTRCYKNFHKDFFEILRELNPYQGMVRIARMTCEKQSAWQLHHDGTPPELALQQESTSQSRNQAKEDTKWARLAFLSFLSFLAFLNPPETLWFMFFMFFLFFLMPGILKKKK